MAVAVKAKVAIPARTVAKHARVRLVLLRLSRLQDPAALLLHRRAGRRAQRGRGARARVRRLARECR